MVCLSACSPSKEQQIDMHFVNDIILPHTPIRNQGRTQTCWAYSMASLFESEYMKTCGDTLRLSVMYAVRQKYMKQFEQYYYSKGYDEIREAVWDIPICLYSRSMVLCPMNFTKDICLKQNIMTIGD